MPQASGEIANTQQLTAQLTLTEQTITGIEVSAQGVLEDGEQTPFSITATMENIEDQASFDIPQAVLDAANNKDAVQLPAMTDELLTLLTAWYQWNQQDTHLAKVTLMTNCGPVVVNDQLELFSASLDEKPVYGIRKNSLSVYWSDGQLLNQDGSPVAGDQQSPEDLVQLLDTTYLICQDGTFTTARQDSTTLYTMTLTGDSMEEIAEMIAPDAAKLGPELTGGTLTVRVTNGAIAGISFDLGGNITIATFGADVSITGQITFQDGDVTIPEAVQETIR